MNDLYYDTGVTPPPYEGIRIDPFANLLSDIITNGGGTYDALTLAPVKFDHGFIVAVGGCEIDIWNDDALEDIKAALAYYPRAYVTGLVGTWLSDDGYICIDAVRYIAEYDFAVALGRSACQAAIWDNAAGEALYL